MYQVFCRSPKKFSRWVFYSAVYLTREEAEAVMARAIGRRTCDSDGNLLEYKVKEVEADR